MLSKKQILGILILLPLLIFMASAENSSRSSLKEFLGKVVNFVILSGGLGYILYKPVRSFLEKRTTDVRRKIRESEESKKEAEQKLKEARQKLTGLQEEILRIKEAAELEGMKEKERIKSFTEKEIERIRRLSQQEIEMQVKAGIQELKEHTADLAVALAEAKIKKKITPQGQVLLIDKSIERLAKLDDKSNSG